jgi:hypothetical protein
VSQPQASLFISSEAGASGTKRLQIVPRNSSVPTDSDEWQAARVAEIDDVLSRRPQQTSGFTGGQEVEPFGGG